MTLQESIEALNDEAKSRNVYIAAAIIIASDSQYSVWLTDDNAGRDGQRLTATILRAAAKTLDSHAREPVAGHA